MSTELASAYVQIIPSAKGISGSISSILEPEADKAGKSAGGKLGSALGTAAKVGAGAITAATAALAAGGAAFVKSSNEVAQYGDNVDKMSQKLGLSAKSYQEWDYVMQLAGTDMGSMTTGLKTLTNKLDDAKNGSDEAKGMFEKLGISMEDINMRKPSKGFRAWQTQPTAQPLPMIYLVNPDRISRRFLISRQRPQRD